MQIVGPRYRSAYKSMTMHKSKRKCQLQARHHIDQYAFKVEHTNINTIQSNLGYAQRVKLRTRHLFLMLHPNNYIHSIRFKAIADKRCHAGYKIATSYNCVPRALQLRGQAICLLCACALITQRSMQTLHDKILYSQTPILSNTEHQKLSIPYQCMRLLYSEYGAAQRM